MRKAPPDDDDDDPVPGAKSAGSATVCPGIRCSPATGL